MTKLYISADIEGIAGVTSPLQCFRNLDATAYQEAVAQMTLEVNTVVEAALEAGVDYILVNDSHGYMTNLTVAALNPQVHLLSGKPKLCAMSAGLDSTYDGAFYIGYHAKAGTQAGILNHTFHPKLFDVQVNGVSYGEGGINALYASLMYGVPVVLASGDAAFCQEIQQVIPKIALVETKQSLTFSAALNYPMTQVLEAYQSKTRDALGQIPRWKENLLHLEAPYRLQVTFIDSLAADVAMTLPWITRLDGRTVAYEASDFKTLYQVLQSLYAILAYTAYMED